MSEHTHHEHEKEKETPAVVEDPVSSEDFIDEETGNAENPKKEASADVDPTTKVELPNPDDIGDPMPARYVSLLGLPMDTLQGLFDARARQIGELKFLESAETPGTYDYAILNAIRQTFPETERTQDALALVPKDHQLSRKLIDGSGKTILGDATLRRNTTNYMDQPASGTLGTMRMRAGRRRGMLRRIPLYASGFYIDVRVPNLDDIFNGLIRKCRLDHQVYGNQFGAHYYMYNDLLMINNFAFFALDIIQRANLKGYTKAQVLLNNILLPDFLALMTYVAAMMWPDGYPDYIHACTRPTDAEHPKGCDWHITKKIDINEMVLTDFTRMNPDAVTHMSKCRTISHEVTEADLLTYRQNVGIKSEVIEFEDLRIELYVPSVTDWIAAGEAFNSDLTNDIQADNMKGIYEALSFRSYRIFIPWIKSITVVDDNGSPLSFTDDKEDISEMLDDIQSEDVVDMELQKKIYDYINRMQITHVGYKVFKCPKCGFEPHTKSGYFTVDPCATFFTQSLRKLTAS